METSTSQRDAEISMLQNAISQVSIGRKSFFRYITANDVGRTGGHQCGFYVPKGGASVLFEELGIRGENKEKLVRIVWPNNISTDSRFIYYGRGTRDEYRITRFGRNFPYLQDEYVGSLLIITQIDTNEYVGHILSRDIDIDGFFEYFNISPTSSECLIEPNKIMPYEQGDFLRLFLSKYDDFPSSRIMAFWGQKYKLCCESITRSAILGNPDRALKEWIDAEYLLYQALEEKIYAPIYTTPFGSVNQLVELANTILNRRKSRAGKSLEHHLERILQRFQLQFEAQVQTEGKKRPDFIFPSSKAYHDPSYASDRLIFLAAKTTCKDRWRQIINEADRIEHKFLFTLQKGISTSQLQEMTQERVSLVVPQSHISSFDAGYQSKILSLQSFIHHVQTIQG